MAIDQNDRRTQPRVTMPLNDRKCTHNQRGIYLSLTRTAVAWKAATLRVGIQKTRRKWGAPSSTYILCSRENGRVERREVPGGEVCQCVLVIAGY